MNTKGFQPQQSTSPPPQFGHPQQPYHQQTYGNPQYPYQSGQFQQPPYYNPPPPPPTYNGPGPHNFRGWTLAALVICYLAALFMAIIDTLAVNSASPGGVSTTSGSNSNVVSVVGAGLLIALVIFIIVKDTRSYFTLFGRIRWRRLNGFVKFLLGLLYLVCWIMTPIYIVMAIQHHLRMRQQTLGQSLQSGWRGYRAKKTSTQVSLAFVSAILLVFFAVFTSVGAAVDRNMALGLITPTPTASTLQVVAPTATPTATPVVNAVDTSVATTAPTDTPTATPTPQPKQKPTPKPTSKPTPKPPPKPTTCPGINCNPWGYNFNSGGLIYTPPNGFCNYFNCIASFYGSDDPGDGYIVECQDSTYSQSGGERGACSYHGGVLQPLYSHYHPN